MPRKLNCFRLVAVLAVWTMAALAPRAAEAGVLYDFSYTGSGNGDVSGQFDVSSGIIDGITGTSSLFGTITGLTSLFGNDNVFSASSPWLSNGGVSFTTTSGTSLNLFTLNPSSWGLSRAGLNGFGALTVSAATVPEPMSAALIVTGLIGLGLTRYRRRV